MITAVLALAPERGAVETLEGVLALPDLAADTIVIQGTSEIIGELSRTFNPFLRDHGGKQWLEL
jgi:hypothetical protein